MVFFQHTVKSVEILASYPGPIRERLVTAGSEFMSEWRNTELPAEEKKEFDRIWGVLTALGRIDETVPEMTEEYASEVARDVCRFCRAVDMLELEPKKSF